MAAAKDGSTFRLPLPEEIVQHRVHWWQCDAVYIPSLKMWSGGMFRAHFRVAGLPWCSMRRWHRGPHFWEMKDA